MIFGCDNAIDFKKLEKPNIAGVSFFCVGMIPPTMIEYALKKGVDGVFITGCRTGSCYFRHGNLWMDKRFDGSRRPILRKRAERQRINVFRAAETDSKELNNELQQFQEKIATLKVKGNNKDTATVNVLMKSIVRYPLQAFNYAVFMALVWYFSILPPYHQLDENQAMITFTMSHTGKHVSECKNIPYEELMKLPANMRKPTDCPRERSPVITELRLDDDVIYSHTAPPLGLYKDQGIDIYENIKVRAGKHRIKVWLNDDVKVEGPIYMREQDVDLQAEQHLVIQFESNIMDFSIK